MCVFAVTKGACLWNLPYTFKNPSCLIFEQKIAFLFGLGNGSFKREEGKRGRKKDDDLWKE